MHSTEILSGEHRVIEQVVSCLEAMADRAVSTGDIDRASVREALDFFRTFADGCHHRKEEECLFPMLESRGWSRERGPTGVMFAEHELGRRFLRAIEIAVEEEDPWSFAGHANAYAALLREHIAKEDRRLFPMAAESLTTEDEQHLLAAFEDVEDAQSRRDLHEKYLRVAAGLAQRYAVAASPAPLTACGCGH